MLISEELSLLLTTPQGTPDPWIPNQNTALGGALLTDVIVSGHVEFDGDKNPHVDLVSSTSKHTVAFDHPVITFGIDALASRRRLRAEHVVGASWFNPRKIIGHHLAQQGIVDVLHGFGMECYPANDETPRTQLQQRLTAALTAPQNPTMHDAVLLALLHQINGITRALPEAARDLPRAKIRQRVTAIAASDHGVESAAFTAVKRSIDTLQAVIAGAASSAVL